MELVGWRVEERVEELFEYVSAATVLGELPTEEQFDGRALIIHAYRCKPII